MRLESQPEQTLRMRLPMLRERLSLRLRRTREAHLWSVRTLSLTVARIHRAKAGQESLHACSAEPPLNDLLVRSELRPPRNATRSNVQSHHDRTGCTSRIVEEGGRYPP